ncbi:hypothetical protein N7G274_009385 [Stereocaulon virgatum]|uniref:Protein CMS1 n=1 Tax=Stereocaulon virgatum TaxID=373712 RepID=A0ABR3ZWC9_9LECA
MSESSRSSLTPSPGLKNDSLPSSPCAPHTAKRKRSTEGDRKTAPVKLAKRKKSKKTKPDEDEDLDLKQGLNLAIGRFDSRLEADYVAQRTKRFSSDLSSVELEDRHIPETAFRNTSEWKMLRTLQNMPDFLDRYSTRIEGGKSLSTASKKPGSPHTLVITSAGLRAADITRALRTFQTKEAVVAKLFAKHIKLNDAVEYVKKTRIGIGVGTPSRIIDLLDAGALMSSKLERVVIDSSHIDQKKRGIFDMRETQRPLMLLLNRPELKTRYGGSCGNLEVLMY